MNHSGDIKKQTFIYAYSNFFRILLSLIVNGVLSRLLEAYDFGVATIISIFSLFFITISDVGISPAIVQIKDLDINETDGIYSFTVYLAMASSVLFCLIAFPVSYIYKDDIYIPLCLLLSISVFFGILNMVPTGILNRDKKFVFLAVRNVITSALSATVAISSAIKGFGIYSIVFQSVVSSILLFIFDYAITKPRFTFRFNISGLKRIANFSGFQFIFNIVCYLSRSIDDLLTGKFISTTELGFYNKAYSLMLYPVDNLVGVFSPVIHPVLSDYQKNHSIIFDIYIKISRILLLLGCFVSAVCFTCSDEIVTIICGTGWNRTILCFKIMSIAIMPQMLNSCVGAVFQSIGNTKLLFYNSLVNVTFSFIVIFIAVFGFKDIFSLSIAIALAYYFHYFASHIMVFTYGFKRSCKEYFLRLKKEFVVFLVLQIMAVFIKFSIDNIIIIFIYKFVTVSLLFLILIIVTGDYKLIIDFLIKKKFDFEE